MSGPEGRKAGRTEGRKDGRPEGRNWTDVNGSAEVNGGQTGIRMAGVKARFRAETTRSRNKSGRRMKDGGHVRTSDEVLEDREFDRKLVGTRNNVNNQTEDVMVSRMTCETIGYDTAWTWCRVESPRKFRDTSEAGAGRRKTEIGGSEVRMKIRKWRRMPEVRPEVAGCGREWSWGCTGVTVSPFYGSLPTRNQRNQRNQGQENRKGSAGPKTDGGHGGRKSRVTW
ncbi:hypothetical protein C8R45DRAFT_926004 [Mycena sanguinolenta]|nr:hypothetical protein C8R45DRAFT_926004 [Mycena sanguinolenta]